MKIVLTLPVAGVPAEVVDAQVAFHLNAGVDLVLATGLPDEEMREALDAYARTGLVALARGDGGLRGQAFGEHGADWVIESGAGEFWWPRGENLADVLAAIPERYTVVQALVRRFAATPDDGRFFADRMTERPSLASGERTREPLERVLRPVYRAGPEDDRLRVPLRAWYPIEVLSFPLSGPEGASAEDGDPGAGPLVPDRRLVDALAALRSGASGTPGRFALPAGGAGPLAFRAPDVVDDAAYAIECAAVGEVDLASLEQQIDDLERRIAWLEQRFWPRVLRRLSRLTGRSRE